MAEKARSKRPVRRPQQLLLAVAVLCILLEAGARIYFATRPPLAADDIALLYRPHPYRVYMLAPKARSARGHVSINSHGFRGPEITLSKPPNTVRIACFGGSATYNDTATTDGHTYPAHLERFLRQHYVESLGRPKAIEVINAGVPGYTSLESLIYLESKVLDYDLDIAIFHHGLNDAVFMTYFREFASDYVHARKIFFMPKPHLWERSAFLTFLLPERRSISNPFRSNRKAALAQLTLLDPDRLRVSEREQRRCFKPERIEIFARNVRNFIYVARGHGIIPVLSTMTISPKAGFFAEVVGKVNDRIREIARRLKVPCVDFAREMPWSDEAFVDNCHLRDSPQGLERKGKIFARYLIRQKIIERALEKQRR